MEILRRLDSSDCITVFSFEAGFNEELIENITRFDKDVTTMHFIEQEKRVISSYIKKQVMVPAHISGDFTVSSYHGIRFEFDLDDSFIDFKEVKEVVESINRQTSNKKRQYFGVIKGGKGTNFFCY